MNRSTIIRLGTTTLVSGLAGVALAVPAAAVEAPDPAGGLAPAPSVPGAGAPGAGAPAPDVGIPWTELGLGALGWLALVGVGLAGSRRQEHQEVSPTGEPVP